MKYAYEIQTRRVKDPDFPYHGQVLDSPWEVNNFVSSLMSMDREQVVVMYLNGQNKLLGISKYDGTVNYALVSPRDIIKTCLLTGATGIVMAHNHPSGALLPSQEDQAITEKVRECCEMFEVRLLDHCIISEDGYTSMQEHGYLSDLKSMVGTIVAR